MKFILSLQVGHSSVKTQASVAVVFPCILDIPAEEKFKVFCYC